MRFSICEPNVSGFAVPRLRRTEHQPKLLGRLSRPTTDTAMLTYLSQFTHFENYAGNADGGCGELNQK
jgi:hypothetical protein